MKKVLLSLLFVINVFIYSEREQPALSHVVECAKPVPQIFDIASSQNFCAPSTVDELQRIVQYGSKISLVGAGKSQGGQTISSYKNTYCISLHNLNQLIYLDVPCKQVTVQAGMTWKQLQEYIAPHGLAVKAMQSYNDFSIGGSISVNVHGQDISTGQIISTVICLKVLLPDGNIITASRNEHAQIFYAIVGGYGLVGIIIEATLQLTDDILLERHAVTVDTASFVEHFNNHIRNNQDIEFYSARFSVSPLHFMEKVFIITYQKSSTTHRVYSLLPVNQSSVIRYMIQATGVSLLLKSLRFPFEQLILDRPEIVSRNNFLNYSIQGLPQNNRFSEYVLQEYFLPYDRVTSFIKDFARLTKDYAINILNVTARHVLQDVESLLSFSPKSDMCALVVYIRLPRAQEVRSNFVSWTRLMIDQIINYGGTYYLPYHLLATKDQFQAMYPGWQDFLRIKHKYDPCDRLSNQLYEQYAM